MDQDIGHGDIDSENGRQRISGATKMTGTMKSIDHSQTQELAQEQHSALMKTLAHTADLNGIMDQSLELMRSQTEHIHSVDMAIRLSVEMQRTQQESFQILYAQSQTIAQLQADSVRDTLQSFQRIAATQFEAVEKVLGKPLVVSWFDRVMFLVLTVGIFADIGFKIYSMVRP
jgi:hypothetical protein